MALLTWPDISICFELWYLGVPYLCFSSQKVSSVNYFAISGGAVIACYGMSLWLCRKRQSYSWLRCNKTVFTWLGFDFHNLTELWTSLSCISFDLMAKEKKFLLQVSETKEDEEPKPTVNIDEHSDPDATIVEICFGDRLGALLDTVCLTLWRSCKQS